MNVPIRTSLNSYENYYFEICYSPKQWILDDNIGYKW